MAFDIFKLQSGVLSRGEISDNGILIIWVTILHFWGKRALGRPADKLPSARRSRSKNGKKAKRTTTPPCSSPLTALESSSSGIASPSRPLPIYFGIDLTNKDGNVLYKNQRFFTRWKFLSELPSSAQFIFLAVSQLSTVRSASGVCN